MSERRCLKSRLEIIVSIPEPSNELRDIVGTSGARFGSFAGQWHANAFWRGLMDAKGWHVPRQVRFLDDLRAGRMLADLERAG